MGRIFEKMKEGLRSSVFPGAVLLIAHREKIVMHEAFGAAMIMPEKQEMRRETVFDLASLTKPLVTTAAMALLLQDKGLSLEDRLTKYIPEFSGGDKDDMTLFHLLTHSSGLPAWRPYSQAILEQEKNEKDFIGSKEAETTVLKMAHDEALIALPGEKSLYSDVGFILLGEVIEQVSQMSLDLFYTQQILTPSKSTESFFVPIDESPSDLEHFPFAATEDLPHRNGVIQGIVHDDNAYVMGGVAGHAGLFSTALGVYHLVSAWNSALKGSGFLSPEIATRFVTRQQGREVPEGSSRALGWDTPSHPRGSDGPGISSSGHHFSASSFGHLGFTGTSIWVDQEKELVVIFLSNRVHPSSKNEAIRKFRPELHDIIFEEVVGA